jgi:hypothetical protein
VVHRHRLADILELSGLEREHRQLQLVLHDSIHDLRDADPARRSFRLHARRDVHAVAHDISAAHEHIPQVDADAMPQRLTGRHVFRALEKVALRLNGPFDCFDGAAEKQQQSVARRLDYPAGMTSAELAHLGKVALQKRESRSFVGFDPAAEADGIRKYNGREQTLLARSWHGGI